MDRLVEIRAYQLKPGAASQFHRLMREQAVPLLEAAGTEVVAYGPSPHDADAYFLVRAYASLEQRNTEQDAFYGSPAWRNGPREAVIGKIETFLDTVLWLSDAAIESLRQLNVAPEPV